MKRIIAATLSAASLAVAGNAIADDDMAQAELFLESGQYVLARDHLRAAAENGDALAAEILGFMHGSGPRLFPGVQQDLREAAHWFDLAARGGRPVGHYMVCALRKPAGAPVQVTSGCFDWVADTGRPGSR